MITIQFDELEFYDSSVNEFVMFPERTVNFEYSLRALSRWESKWKKPFLTTRRTTDDIEFKDFILCMGDDPELTIDYLDSETCNVLNKYITDPHTATTFSNVQNDDNTNKGKANTAEEIYALMFMNSVPLEMENRNLNHLLVILRIISVYTSPPKKKSTQEILRENALLNQQRKAAHNTKG